MKTLREKSEERIKKDKAILSALYFGNHLEPEELKRTKELLYLLNINLKLRK